MDNKLLKTHAPIIEVPEEYELDSEVEIKVAVGAEKHPMASDHFIKSIELYKNNELVKRVDLSQSDQPEAIFSVVLDGSDELTAKVECNVHGFFENSRNV